MTDVEQAQIQFLQTTIHILKLQLAAAHRFIDELVASGHKHRSAPLIGMSPTLPEGKIYPEHTAVPYAKTLNIRDGAKYLRVDRATFVRLIREGAIVGEKVGTRWFVEREMLDRLVRPQNHVGARFIAPSETNENEAVD
jgi:excisionase family DNA binding protein